MHLDRQIIIAAQEAESADAVAMEAWDALQAAHEGRPHLVALRAAFFAAPVDSAERRAAAHKAWENALLVEAFDAYSARAIAAEVASMARRRLAALRALAAADTYECAAGAGVAQ